MKKVLVIVIMCLCICGCGEKKIFEPKYKSDIRNAKTLDEYIKALNDNELHEHLNELGINENDIYYYPEKFKCDILKDNNIMYFDYNGFVLENGDYYEYTTEEGKLYSNNEQCLKKDDFIVKKISNAGLFTTDNKLCFRDYNLNKMFYNCNREGNRIESFLLKKDDVLKVIASGYSEYKNNEWLYDYYVIKTDGKLYKLVISDKYYNDKFTIKKEEIFLDSDKYGKISDAEIYFDNDYKNIEIRKLITDKGLYTLENIETEECIKYVDVECKKELKVNEVLDKYKDSIKYYGKYKIVTKDNLIISSDITNKKLIEFK